MPTSFRQGKWRGSHCAGCSGFFHAWVGWILCKEELPIETEFLHPMFLEKDPVTGKKEPAWEALDPPLPNMGHPPHHAHRPGSGTCGHLMGSMPRLVLLL
jgi:hypothetical protein